MKANYNLTGTKRKELVNAIAEITGEKADYKRMPTCAYEIGDITVDKDGSVTCEDEEKLKKVREALNEKGFTAEGEQEDGKAEQPEQVATTEKENATGQEPALTISLPLASANIDTLKNLISAKESLIKKALGITDTQINITDDKIEFPRFDRELYPQFLDDRDSEERDAGKKCGLQFLNLCDEMWDLGRKITQGMAAEIAAANANGIPSSQSSTSMALCAVIISPE